MSIFTSELFEFVNIPVYHFVKKLIHKFFCVCVFEFLFESTCLLENIFF